MAVTVANSPLKKMTYNGQKVKKWVHDGAVVYKSSNFPDGVTFVAGGTNVANCYVRDDLLHAESYTEKTNGSIRSSAKLLAGTDFKSIVFVVGSASRSGNATVSVGFDRDTTQHTFSSIDFAVAVTGPGEYTVTPTAGVSGYIAIACWGSSGPASVDVTGIVFK